MKHFSPLTAAGYHRPPPPDTKFALIAYVDKGIEYPQRPIPAQTWKEIYTGSGSWRYAVGKDAVGFVVFDLFYCGLSEPGLWQRYETRDAAIEAAGLWSVR